MGGALVSKVHSAAARQEMLRVELIGPTAQVIAGGVKQNLEKLFSLQTLNPKPLNPYPSPCTVHPKP